MGIFGPRRKPDSCETCERALARADESVRAVKLLAADFEELLDKVTRASARARKRDERDAATGEPANGRGSGDNPDVEGNPVVARIMARRNRMPRMPQE